MTLELAPKRGMERKNWKDEGANAKVNNETKQTETVKHKTADSMKFNFIFFPSNSILRRFSNSM